MKKDPEKKDIVLFLNRLNQDIQKFLGNSHPSSADLERWSELHKSFELLRCREIMKCDKDECPAFHNEDYRCWLLAGTLCNSCYEGDLSGKFRDCFTCNVFGRISEEPVRALYENIDILISHLQSRADKLRDIAIKDQLTGLYNRHFFNETIERELARADRDDQALSFIMLDMDNLKGINDSLGHLTGDKILLESANIIREAVRKSDLVFRFGGDEFLVLLVNGDCYRTAVVGQRIVDSVEKWNRDNAASYGWNLSFSMGCAVCEKGCDIYAVLNEADEKMYKNKREKRNAFFKGGE